MFDFDAAVRDPEQIQATPPTPRDPFDLEPVERGLEPFAVKLDELAQIAAAHEVTDEGTQGSAVEMAAQAKRLGKALDEVRVSFVRPHNEFVKSVNALAKRFDSRLAQIEGGLKRKISIFCQAQELERRKREQAAQRAAAEAQKRIDAEAKAAGVETVTIDAPVIPPADPVIRTAAGSAYQERFWSFEVQDEAQIPREYLMVDERKLRDAVKAGVRTIPGVRIWEDSRTKIRT
jgi:hypothetical protein